MLRQGKRAVIYGAGGAVGAAVARAFAREGARVFLAGRTRATLETVADDIVAAGGTAGVSTVNASDECTLQAHVDAVSSETGGIDVAFNAIGMDACEAIEGLWRTLAAELGPHGIRVVCLRSAGSPDAPAVRDVFALHAAAAGLSFEEYVATAGRASLLGRLPALAEVANAAVLLASNQASALTGTFVNVTCGSRVD